MEAQVNEDVSASRWKAISISVSTFLGVVFALSALHLYGRRLLLREERQRQRALVERLRIQLAASTLDSLQMGLPWRVLASIPSVPYRESIYYLSGDQTDCPVCLVSFGQDEVVRILPNCNHTFHVDCIDMWLGSHVTCPVCRTGAEPKPLLDLAQSSRSKGDHLVDISKKCDLEG